jgi:signal transduction histidine kinase/ActR/RegA family two-component response regulator
MGIDKDKRETSEATELRRRAEELVQARMVEEPPRTETETQQLLHELQVHQIELEMQNEELQRARKTESAALEKFTELYDFAPVGYCTLDREGIILGVNLTGAALLRIERSRLIGRRIGLFVSIEDRNAFADFLGKVFTSLAKEACDVKLLNEGNSPQFVRIEAVAATSGEECRVALLDISERKRAEEELCRAKVAAEAATRAKSLFLANMSHELRTPMTGFLGMLDIVLLGNLEAEQREFIETAHTSARSFVRILNDILDMSRIEAGKLSMEEKPFSVRNCLEDMIKIFLPVAKSKGLGLNLTVADDVPETLVADQIRLNQVLTNLAGNAVKFTEKGKVEIRVVASGSVPGSRRAVTFTVADTGIGIPADKQELIFQSFTQADESHTREYGGTGLGLAIAKEIVERMGGTITFTSEVGIGSTFSFTIPFAEAEAERDEGFTSEGTATAGDLLQPEVMTKPRLLVAEDDPVTRKVLGMMFQVAKYETDFAENGQKVVEMWENGKYDLVLMDVQMPLLNGFEATAAIREKERTRGGHIPIVAMTAHALKEDEERCLGAGMDAYISKPIDLKECLRLIGETLKKTGVAR